jgi:hypothetical protein
MLIIAYLVFAAFIGFMVSYVLISLQSLPPKDALFRITNYLTTGLVLILSIACTVAIVYLAYMSIKYFNRIHIDKSFLKTSLTLQFIKHDYNKQPLKYILIASIVLITAIKLNLIGTGFLAFNDEVRYCQSGKAFQDILGLKIHDAIRAIYFTQGRPADGLLNVIPIGLQYVTAHLFNLNYFESNNSYMVFIINFIIYCCILVIHYKFSKLLLKESYLALISVVLFSTLTNSYLYLRHALPYDKSLLIFYLVIYKTAIYTEENSLSFEKSLLIGMCSFFGFLVYPGYFPLFIVGLFILLFNNVSKRDFLKRIAYSGYYILGSILCLYIFEKISRLVGTSYILDAIGLSGTITQGSFEESFSYIFKYLIQVEGLTGIILIITLPIFFLMMLYKLINQSYKEYSLMMLLSIAITGNYLVYASTGYFLHKVVLYGRLLHQYFPFICIFSVYSINELLIKITKKNKLILYFISLIFILNFGFNFINYNSYAYPRDILWQLIKAQNSNALEQNFNYENHWPVMPQGKILIYSDLQGKPINSYYNIILNDHNYTDCRLYLINDSDKDYIFNPNDNYHLLESKLSFINFKAYQYDSGANMIERNIIGKRKVQIEIYSKLNNKLRLK